jgi:zinc protease
VQRFAQTYLQNSSRVVVHAVPGPKVLAPEASATPHVPTQAGVQAAAEAAVNADEPWRRTQPKASGNLDAVLPVPASFQLPNGLTVIALSRTAGMPVVSASLVVRSGSDANPPDKPGLASFTSAMLDQGTSTRSALQLADDAAQIGATLSTGSSRDGSTVNVSSLRRNFPAALALLADVALRPSFPTEEVERIRAARLADLVQQRSNPAAVAVNVTAMTLYGEDHPYGHPEMGSPTSNKSLSRDDLRSFWQRHYVPGNAALVVAGPIPVPELRKIAESALGAWPRATGVPVRLPVPNFSAPRLVIVDRPGSPQTQLRVATFGVPRTSPDYVSVRVMNTILGGMFASRINMSLREAHGYTYGANSTVQFARSGGPFSVQTGVRTDVTAPALHEVQLELRKMIDTRVTVDELTLAKASITQSLPATFESNNGTVNALSTLFSFDLPLNYYSTLGEQVSVVDAQAVQEAAKKYLVPDRMVVVAVGDSSRIRQGLEAEVGPAQMRNEDGQAVK